MSFEALEEIYNSLPKIACQGKCQGCCTLIGISPIEVDYLHHHGHGLPIARYSRNYDYLMCSYLTQAGKCQIHPHKPLICRLWGLTENMRCPYGCEPERVLTQDECFELMSRVDALKLGTTYFNKDGWGSDKAPEKLGTTK